MTPENRSTAETLIYNKGDTTFLGIYNQVELGVLNCKAKMWFSKKF